MNGAGSLGRRLRWARAEQGITLQQLSDKCGRGVSYLSQLETGAKDNPTRQTVEALADALGVRPTFLFGEVPTPPFDDRSTTLLSKQAARLGGRFRTHWEGLAEADRFELSLATSHERFCLVIRFMLALAPRAFTPIELAWQLGMSLGQYRDILEQGAEVSHLYLEQLARMAGVPLSFFTLGSMEPAAPAHELAGEAVGYIRVICLAAERKITPERLEALILALDL